MAVKDIGLQTEICRPARTGGYPRPGSRGDGAVVCGFFGNYILFCGRKHSGILGSRVLFISDL